MNETLNSRLKYITSREDSFDPPEPCATVAQPIRHEERLQKAELSKEYLEAYQNIKFSI